MEDTSDRNMNVCCSKCLITFSRRKCIFVVSVTSLSGSIILFLASIIVLGLQSEIYNKIIDSKNDLNESSLSDYDLQTYQTYLVRVNIRFTCIKKFDMKSSIHCTL